MQMVKTGESECCRVTAVVTVDSKGQVVLPKDLREKADIKPNDKLALIGMQRGETVCCIVIMKADALGSSVKNILGPIFNEAFSKK
jgi:AbrB family looped-hinge helix DNA binding protein